MKIKFTKMQGLGNDFIVLDGTAQPIKLNEDQYRQLADRHFGIGCDQILIVEPAASPENDFRYRIINANGQQVEQCGNGARCFMRFVHDKKLSRKHEIRVETLKGIIIPRLEADGQVTVDMGPPYFLPEEIPFKADKQALTYKLKANGESYEVGVLSMGNPHAVQTVTAVDHFPVAEIGAQIAQHPDFPAGANAGFMQVIRRDLIKLRVFERGAGETLACGTGACAAVVMGRVWGLLDPTVKVVTRGGALTIHWQGEGHSVWMTGPAVMVFEGEVEI